MFFVILKLSLSHLSCAPFVYCILLCVVSKVLGSPDSSLSWVGGPPAEVTGSTPSWWHLTTSRSLLSAPLPCLRPSKPQKLTRIRKRPNWNRLIPSYSGTDPKYRRFGEILSGKCLIPIQFSVCRPQIRRPPAPYSSTPSYRCPEGWTGRAIVKYTTTFYSVFFYLFLLVWLHNCL